MTDKNRPKDRAAKDLKSELESLWKTTVEQFDELTDVLVKTSEAGKAKLDATMLRRARQDALARLGARVRDDRGTVELPSAWRDILDEIDRIDARIAEEDARFGRAFSGKSAEEE